MTISIFSSSIYIFSCQLIFTTSKKLPDLPKPTMAIFCNCFLAFLINLKKNLQTAVTTTKANTYLNTINAPYSFLFLLFHIYLQIPLTQTHTQPFSQFFAWSTQSIRFTRSPLSARVNTESLTALSKPWI